MNPLITAILSRLPSPQAAAAKRCGISQAYLSQIIAGKRVPPLATLQRMAEAAGLELRVAKRKALPRSEK